MEMKEYMSQSRKENCPECNTKGQSVDNATIKSLICVSLHRVKDVSHRFCSQPNCSIVYYAEDHSKVFYQHELREQVYQKAPNANDVLVCYCFFHTLGEIKASAESEEHSSIVEDIRFGIQQGHCACDWRNPQGNCCLGNILEIIKQHR